MNISQTFRLTHQRRVILEELKLARSHPTAHEIYERVRQRLPHISLGTVYRNLELLTAHGRIRKLEAAGGLRRFEANLDQHYHVRCMACGRVDDVTIEAPVALEKMVSSPGDYQICGARLEFVGLCPACRAANQRHCVEQSSIAD